MNAETGGYVPEQSEQKMIAHVLYHVAGFEPDPNDEFIDLNPGTQHSTGEGVYFTENFPQTKYAGGEKNQCRWPLPHLNIFKVELGSDESKDWFRAKNKPMRPRFWHSKNRSLKFKNRYEEQEIDGQLCHVYSDIINDEVK